MKKIIKKTKLLLAAFFIILPVILFLSGYLLSSISSQTKEDIECIRLEKEMIKKGVLAELMCRREAYLAVTQSYSIRKTTSILSIISIIPSEVIGILILRKRIKKI